MVLGPNFIPSWQALCPLNHLPVLFSHLFIWLVLCMCILSSVNVCMCTEVSMCGECLHVWSIQTRGQSWVSLYRTLPILIFETGSITGLNLYHKAACPSSPRDLHASTHPALGYKYIHAHLAFYMASGSGTHSGPPACKASAHA